MLAPIAFKENCTGGIPHTKHQATSKPLRSPPAPNTPGSAKKTQ